MRKITLSFLSFGRLSAFLPKEHLSAKEARQQNREPPTFLLSRSTRKQNMDHDTKVTLPLSVEIMQTASLPFLLIPTHF